MAGAFEHARRFDSGEQVLKLRIAFHPCHGEAAVIANNLEVTRSAFQIRLQDKPTVGFRREFRAGVLRAVELGEPRILVDCASWQELDLILLSVLVDCASVCEERGVAFELVNVADIMRRRIDALQLGSRLKLAV